MLKVTFCSIVIIHALIHGFGFAKAFSIFDFKQLPSISKVSGIFWLVAFLLLTTTIIMYLTTNKFWWIAGIISALLSQILILTVWQEARFGTIANIILILASIVGYETYKYRANYSNDITRNLKVNNIKDTAVLSEQDISRLPEPVKKYIRYTGFIGKPKISSFKIQFEGQLRKNDDAAWMPFISEQYNFIYSPTRLFFLNATMMQLPVAGYHCYINGLASMDIRLFSIFKVQYMDGPEMNVAETVTFLNDMCCMAPGTLIDKRITWSLINDTSVTAKFTYNNISITADLIFNSSGELINFLSDDRYSTEDAKKVRWSTPLSNYFEINGYKLAGNAKTIYSYPDRDFCYGTFKLKSAIYNPSN